MLGYGRERNAAQRGVDVARGPFLVPDEAQDFASTRCGESGEHCQYLSNY
mgnify:CR=1 FL=1